MTDNLAGRALSGLRRPLRNQISRLIRGWHQYYYGSNPNEIIDGGNDMFDGGNRVSFTYIFATAFF